TIALLVVMPAVFWTSRAVELALLFIELALAFLQLGKGGVHNRIDVGQRVAANLVAGHGDVACGPAIQLALLHTLDHSELAVDMFPLAPADNAHAGLAWGDLRVAARPVNQVGGPGV